jgi:hypothetical protein
MTVCVLSSQPEPDMCAALQAFETQFQYPLGEGWFRISHGHDYTCFYRSLGPATCVMTQDEQGITGVCCATERQLHMPGEADQTVLYLGDLKVAPRARGKRVLWQLAQALRGCHPHINAAYGVVMNGTALTPNAYTGRAGLPEFQKIGVINIWQIPTLSHLASNEGVVPVSAQAGEALFKRLSSQQVYSLSGHPGVRSQQPVQWWATNDGSACARMEDTRGAKKLFTHDGQEIISAHLSALAYATPAHAEQLLQAACQQAAQMGMPTLFVSQPFCHQPLPPLLSAPPEATVQSCATVYGTSIQSGLPWHLFTSEI